MLCTALHRPAPPCTLPLPAPCTSSPGTRGLRPQVIRPMAKPRAQAGRHRRRDGAMHSPCARHAHTMRTPCTRHVHTMRTPCTCACARHAHAHAHAMHMHRRHDDAHAQSAAERRCGGRVAGSAVVCRRPWLSVALHPRRAWRGWQRGGRRGGRRGRLQHVGAHHAALDRLRSW